MAFKIVSDTQDTVTIGERLYVTADRETVVPAGDERAAFLLVGEGGTITRAEAERYGLVKGRKASEKTEDDSGPGLQRLNKAELVEHASKLDPPLELDDTLTKKELIAAIEAAAGSDDG